MPRHRAAGRPRHGMFALLAAVIALIAVVLALHAVPRAERPTLRQVATTVETAPSVAR